MRLLLFLFATSLSAAPIINSVSPSSGPVIGGTTVIIRGSGFDPTCPPAPQPCGRTAVFFGQVPAASFTIVDVNTIQAVTPAYLPGPVAVAVTFPGGASNVVNAFTYLGEVADGFEPVLVPLYVPSVAGAFGSFFVTDLSLWTNGAPLNVFGVGYPCGPTAGIFCPPQPPFFATNLTRAVIPSTAFATFGDPGLLIWTEKGGFDRLAASLRVRDLSRQSQDWGTAIPLVPQREFHADFIALLDVPMNAGFRDTLRVYSLDRDASVHVRAIRFDGTVSKEFDLDLKNGFDMFHPGYAQSGDFAVEEHAMRIEIQPRTAGKRIWAFASVTHNETQRVTIVAPH